MGRWARVAGPCPSPGPALLLLLLLLPRGAQPQAARSQREPPGHNATVTPVTLVTSATPSTAAAGAPQAEGPPGGGLTPLPRGAPSNSPGGTVLTEAGQPCRFPFRYGGRMLHSCTAEGSAHRKWCATTHNYDRDRAWGYCVQDPAPQGRPAPRDPCASGPCLHGGSCASTQDPESYHCTCPAAFTGQDCGTEKCFDESRYEYLEPGDRWARVHQGRVERCECAGGQVRCEGTRHTACLSSPCLNGGSCHLIVATGTTVCACPPDYAGRLCNIVPAQRCFVGTGTEYRGVASTAASGLSCLAWNSDLLYQELHVDSVGAAALLGLGPHAYCRNPDKDERPWCYVVKDSALSWEYCRLAACESLARIQPPPTEALLTLPGPAAAGPAGRQTCGKRHKKRTFLRPRIIGGSSSLPGSHPWLAAIYIGNNFCAGSLVHTCWVVSAAHCFSNSPPRESVSVVLGQHFFNRTTDVTQTFGIEKYIPYPLYSVFNPSDHDLGRLRWAAGLREERCGLPVWHHQLGRRLREAQQARRLHPRGQLRGLDQRPDSPPQATCEFLLSPAPLPPAIPFLLPIKMFPRLRVYTAVPPAQAPQPCLPSQAMTPPSFVDDVPSGLGGPLSQHPSGPSSVEKGACDPIRRGLAPRPGDSGQGMQDGTFSPARLLSDPPLPRPDPQTAPATLASLCS
ncbi:hepatocyte growth factor activator isoform X2 [Cervus elaphus]|uniref:hepatocyte growth factor activator isoform X2 n=1 Tax=Cervus elaphus TaxID=9860 RepID=UPI001CC2DB2A|nr:hepatocyte growth factor activator isoform X2 [Cervus elaphus]